MKILIFWKSIKYITMIIIISLISTIVISCARGPIWHPVYDLIIENQTDQVLTITTSQSSSVGQQVGPRSKIIGYFDTHSAYIVLTAKNAQGEVVFSHTYSFDNSDEKYNLQKLGKKGVYICKAVIPPLKISWER